MPSLSRPQDLEVFGLKLQGYTDIEISKKTGVSTGSISNIVRRIKEGMQAGEPDIIIAFHRQLKKADIASSDIIAGAQTRSLLKRLELGEEGVQTFLSQVYPACK